MTDVTFPSHFIKYISFIIYIVKTAGKDKGLQQSFGHPAQLIPISPPLWKLITVCK